MANPAINFAGFLCDDSGDAVSGATINLYDKNTSTTSRASTTTDSNGAWSIAHTTAGEFDIQITSGSSKRRIKFDDKIHLSEVDTEVLNVRGNEGAAAPMYWFADEGDDAGDRWLFNAAAGGVFTMGNDLNSQGTYVAHVTITPNATVANSTFAVAGNLTVGNALTVTGTTTLNGNLVLGDAVASDTLTVGATLQGGTPLVFEGATADGHETSFVITDPTADRTITFPNLTGTVQLSGNPLSGTSLTLSSVSAAGTDTDKFLVLDSSGNVDYRTGTQVLSDIGGGTGGGDMTSFQLEDDDGTEVTISDAKEVKVIGSGVTTNWTNTSNGTDADPYDLTITVDAAQTGITSVYNASLKLGRDADNLVDFATTDNKIIFRVEGVNELELVQNALSPVTSDGVALGTGSLMWSDLFLASGSVINLNNGDITLTHSSETLTVAGGTFATAALTATTGVFSTSIDVTGSAGIILENDETITNSVDGTVLINGNLKVGSGSGAGVYASNGNHDVTLQTGNSTTGSITIVDGANGTITLSPNGTGTSVIEDPVLTVGSDADGDIYYRASNKLARLAKGTADQVLTMNDGATAPGWEDAAGGGGTTTLAADYTITAGHAVAVTAAGTAVEVSGLAEVHDFTGSDVSVSDSEMGSSGWKNYMVINLDGFSGTATHMKLRSWDGWNEYLFIQVGTYTKATNSMVWGAEVRTSHRMETFHAYFDDNSDNVVIAYEDEGDSGAGAILIVQPHATANTHITSSSGSDYAPVRTEFETNMGAATHHGVQVAADTTNNKILVAYIDSGDAGEIKMQSLTLNADHTLTSYIGQTLVTANGQSTRGWQMGFANGKGVVVFQPQDDSYYTRAQGFVVNTGTSAFDIHATVVEPFGQDKLVMLATQSQENYASSGLSYDSTNDVWLTSGLYTDGDSDILPVVGTIKLGTGGEPTVESDGNLFTITTTPDVHKIMWGTVGSALVTTDAHNATLDTVKSLYNHPSVAYDPDRKCWVMSVIQGFLHLDDEDGSVTSHSNPQIYTLVSDADGGGLAVTAAATYQPRVVAHSGRATWHILHWSQSDEYNSLHLSYDKTFDQMFMTGDYAYTYGWAGQTSPTYTRAHFFGTFRGRTVAAGGGAADDTTRALVYGSSNASEFIGFNTTQATNTNTATITVAGGLNENQSGLTRGKRYFVDDCGCLSDKLPYIAENVYDAGVTTATTKLLVKGTSITPL